MTSLGPWFGGGGDSSCYGYDFGSPFSSDIWDFGNRNLDFPGRRQGGGSGDPASVIARTIDWRETSTAHIFRADLPGVKKEEVKVEVEDGNILQISGEQTKEEENENDKWHRFERRRGSFRRRFRLPENANVEEIKCTMENGVLNVTVPKKETEAPPRRLRSIDII